jgi:molybdate transport system substrate-binding protein
VCRRRASRCGYQGHPAANQISRQLWQPSRLTVRPAVLDHNVPALNIPVPANLASSGVGVEVRAGAPKPDISSVAAFKGALLNARSIGYLPTGGVVQLVDRLGIADAIKSRGTTPASDIVSELVAKGELELGVVVLTQILTTPGVELVGPLPPEIQFYSVFTAGVSANSKAPDAARELVKFLTGPTAIPVIKSQGLEPG